MRINADMGMQNSPVNVSNFNRKIAKATGRENMANSINARTDRVSISKQGRQSAKNSLMENLMELRQNVVKSKSELVTATLQKGNTLDSIKPRLEMYEEQLESIDEQMTAELARQAEEAAQKAKEKDEPTKAEEQPKTKEEAKMDNITNLTNLSTNADSVKVISAIKTKLDGNASVIANEIKNDKMRGLDPDRKEGELAKLEGNSAKISSNISEINSTTNEKAQENSSSMTIEEEELEAQQDSE